MFRFKIRAAEHKDAEKIYRLSRDILGTEMQRDTFDKVYFEIIEDVGQIVLAALHSEGVVGFIHAALRNDLINGRYTEITTIAANDYFLERGCGNALVMGVEYWSSKMTYLNIRCSIRDDNNAVRTVLESCGYSEIYRGIFKKMIV